MKIKEVIDYLDSIFHPELQEDYDNSGFLLGDGETEFRGALVALDLTEAVVDEALETGAFNLIVTHHPFIFKGVKRLTRRDEIGRMVWKLIKNNIAVYAAHTNLDNLPWGVSAALGEQLGLQHCRILQPLANNPEAGSGLVGELPEAENAEVFLLRVKQLLGLPTLRYSNNHPLGHSTIRRVALCGGAGSFLIEEALAAGADIYLTGDLKYHDFQRTDGRMVLADIGHYESEQFAKEIIFRAISEKFCNFAVRISERQGSIVQYI